MTHADIREALDGVTGTVAELSLECEGDLRMGALTGALAMLTKCVRVLTDHVDPQNEGRGGIKDGRGKTTYSRHC